MTRDEHLDLLSQVGCSVVPLGPRLVRIDNGEQSTIARVVPLQQPPTPATISREVKRARDAGADIPLFLIPRANGTVRNAGMKGELAAVGAEDRTVIVNGQVLDLSGERSTPRSTMRRRPWGRFAVARDVIRRGGTLSSQVAAAEAVGISQPGAGKAIAILRAEGFVPSAGARQLTPPQLKALIDYAIDSYPGPGGISTYWYNSSTPTLVRELAEALHEANALISGDFAADDFAPWKQPRTLTIYTPSGLDFASRGLAESNRSSANVIVRVPEDATIWRTAAKWADRGSARFTDPVITGWELSQSGDVDNGQAIDRVKQRLLQEAGRL